MPQTKHYDAISEAERKVTSADPDAVFGLPSARGRESAIESSSTPRS
jgi:hypothetical protein